MSLSELIVSIALTSIIMLAVGVFLTSGVRASKVATTVGDTTSQAANAVNEMNRMLRAATTNPVQNQLIDDPAFVVASTESVTFYAYVNLDAAIEKPVKVQFSLDAKRNIVETKWSSYQVAVGYWGFDPTPTSKRVLAGPLATPPASGTPLFTYLSAVTPLAPNGTSLAVGGVVPAASLPSIASVRINAEVGSTTAGLATNTTISNVVGLPNLGS